MKKIESKFVIDSYKNGIETYRKASEEVGLWQSEIYVIQKYIKPEDLITDIGCGAGRTTFGLHALGYQNLIGSDINPEMVKAAQTISQKQNLPISFQVEDATKLTFKSKQFNAAIFSFNGVMTIPQRKSRIKAFQEIHRILKEKGIFIFTTHDREADTDYHKFWEEEAVKWKNGDSDPRLHEFGDIVIHSHDVNGEIYIHIPTRADILAYIEEAGFELVEDFFRPEKFDENESVKAFSGDCRIWVAKKK